MQASFITGFPPCNLQWLPKISWPSDSLFDNGNACGLWYSYSLTVQITFAYAPQWTGLSTPFLLGHRSQRRGVAADGSKQRLAHQSGRCEQRLGVEGSSRLNVCLWCFLSMLQDTAYIIYILRLIIYIYIYIFSIYGDILICFGFVYLIGLVEGKISSGNNTIKQWLFPIKYSAFLVKQIPWTKISDYSYS